jgi:(E)-4-hydroxy-3-methylbut-2-enyl-diphosphate synthase
MAESTMEFLRIFKNESCNDIVISLKASNTVVMVNATRLLVKKMLNEGMNYPLHLGVTEAGDGEDGRIKSAVGIGALFADGIGDTIRVSLTEEPELEIPVAKSIIESFKKFENHMSIAETPVLINPFSYSRRRTNKTNNIGGDNPPVVLTDLSNYDEIDINLLETIGLKFNTSEHQWEKSVNTPDYVLTEKIRFLHKIPNEVKIICPVTEWRKIKSEILHAFPLFSVEEFISETVEPNTLCFVSVDSNYTKPELFRVLKERKNAVLILNSKNTNSFAEQRAFILQLIALGAEIPVIVRRNYKESNNEKFQIQCSCHLGGLFIDGLADGILIHNFVKNRISLSVSTAFNILQASRARIFKTDYISCPGCGRTLFDLQTTTATIKKKTSHLKSLKIGIMGCIVNGIGEMADADYGYVGSANGKISLYKSKQLIKKNIEESNAVDELINIIKTHGDWIE